jgi:uncharacterized protein DUF4424
MLVTALMVVGLASSARANDSTATVGAGGLVLEKTESIAMESEDLYVSADEVRVAYLFRNLSDKPVTTVVAFPMPPRRMSDEFGGDVAYPSGFRTSVDGTPVKVTLERKVVVNGADHRARLEALKIPIAPDSINDATKAMDALPPGQKAELIRLGLAGEEEWDDDGKGMKKHLIPLWTVEDKYWWTQTFAPGRDVRIDHRYVPGAGGSVDTILVSEYFKAGDPEVRQMITRYCMDKEFLAMVARLRKARVVAPPTWIDYILTTGSNWAKPIGDFRLVVDKGKPGNLVSFCGEGVKKISPTQFEMRKRNWRPTSDLQVMILEPRR